VLAAGCREADVLIVDSQRLAKLPHLARRVKKTMRTQSEKMGHTAGFGFSA
jgi:hypothetical protein